MPVDFFAFLTARAAVSLVTAMLTIAIGCHLYQSSGDPFDLALVGLVQIIPIFLFFFVTGWATDSLPRKALLIICTITEAVILIGITMAMLVDDLNLTVIFALLFAHGGVKAFYTPAQQAIIPNIVPREFDVQTDQGLGITGRNICVLGRGDISVHRDRDRVR